MTTSFHFENIGLIAGKMISNAKVCGGLTCQIVFDPFGQNKFSLVILNLNKPTRVEFTLVLTDVEAANHFSRTYQHSFGVNDEASTWSCGNNFIDHCRLFCGGFIINKALTVLLQLNVCFDDLSASRNQWWSQLPNMLFDANTSDFAIEVSKVSIPTHKIILAAHSPVFKAMFDTHMTESATNKIVITDFSEDTVRSLLRCLYDSSALVTEAVRNGQQLLVMADKYDVQSVREEVETHLVRSLSAVNALDMLVFGDAYHFQNIKEAAMEMIVRNGSVMFNTPRMCETLGPDLCNELFRRLAVDAARREVANW